MSHPITRPADPTPATPQALRRRHLVQEKCIRSIGILFYLPAILLLHRGALILSGNIAGLPKPAGLFLAALGVAFVLVGYGFRRLDPAFRLRGGVLAGFGLLLFGVPSLGTFFPAGIAVSAFVLFLIFGPAGRVIYSPAYQRAIAATPEIKAEPPLIVWIAFAVLLIFTALTLLRA